jgi:hypothetical protein
MAKEVNSEKSPVKYGENTYQVSIGTPIFMTVKGTSTLVAVRLTPAEAETLITECHRAIGKGLEIEISPSGW